MLAVMRSLEEWRHFLEGAKQKVEIWTDHKNLEYFMTVKKLNHRQAHWSLYLFRFDFVMHHCLVRAWVNAMPFCDEQIMLMALMTIVIPRCFNLNSLWFVHLKGSRWKGQNTTYFAKYREESRTEGAKMRWYWQ
jgi:hypothetical protein